MDEPNHSPHAGSTSRPGTTSTGTQGPDIVVSGHGQALPAGFQLGNFEVVEVVGVGGFGIVYRARDLALEREVAIKEYMPSVLADRTADYRISVKSEEARDTFVTGLRSFVNEARLLARFSHPALVSVLSYWEGQGTAYMVMPFYEGVTLKRTLRGQPPPDEAWIRQVFVPVLDVLDVLHRAQCLHRDVAPDNILMLGGERPLLLDLGAARQVVGEATQALTAILKPAYAPIEQYSSDGALRQGPWTDVYACAAVLHWVVTGHAPPTAVERMNGEQLPRLDALPEGRYRAGFLGGIRAGLRLRPQDRPQDIASFRALLFGSAPPAAADSDADADADADDDADATNAAPPRALSAEHLSRHPATGAVPTRQSSGRLAPARADPATAVPKSAPTAQVPARPEGVAHVAVPRTAPAQVVPPEAAPAPAAPPPGGRLASPADALHDPDRTRVMITRSRSPDATEPAGTAAPAAALALHPDEVEVPALSLAGTRPGLLAGLAMAALCVVLAAGAWWWHQRGQSAPSSPAPVPAVVPADGSQVPAVPAAGKEPAPVEASQPAPGPAPVEAAQPAPVPAPVEASPPAPMPAPVVAAPAPAASTPAEALPPAAAAQAPSVSRPASHAARPAAQVAGSAAARGPKRGEVPSAAGTTPECREAEMNVAVGNDSADDLARLKAACGSARSR